MAVGTETFLLHGARRSSASYRARIALNLKGVAYRETFHDLQGVEQSKPEYTVVNPQGLVPSLVCPDGLVLSQSLAIIEYLDETFAEPPLLPKDAAGRARVRALAQVVACDIHPVNNLRVRNHVRDLCGGKESAVAAWMDKWSSLGFRAFEELLAHVQTGAFCHGDTPTIADICLVPQVYNAPRNASGRKWREGSMRLQKRGMLPRPRPKFAPMCVRCCRKPRLTPTLTANRRF